MCMFEKGKKTYYTINTWWLLYKDIPLIKRYQKCQFTGHGKFLGDHRANYNVCGGIVAGIKGFLYLMFTISIAHNWELQCKVKFTILHILNSESCSLLGVYNGGAVVSKSGIKPQVDQGNLSIRSLHIPLHGFHLGTVVSSHSPGLN